MISSPVFEITARCLCLKHRYVHYVPRWDGLGTGVLPLLVFLQVLFLPQEPPGGRGDPEWLKTGWGTPVTNHSAFCARDTLVAWTQKWCAQGVRRGGLGTALPWGMHTPAHYCFCILISQGEQTTANLKLLISLRNLQLCLNHLMWLLLSFPAHCDLLPSPVPLSLSPLSWPPWGHCLPSFQQASNQETLPLAPSRSGSLFLFELSLAS